MAEPFLGFHSAALTAIQNSMVEFWDPRVLQVGFRLTEAAKYFRPQVKGFPSGTNYLHIRVQNKLLSAARFIGQMSSSSGVSLKPPAMTMAWDEWKIQHSDLMACVCPVRYSFVTGQTFAADSVGPTAQRLSEESLASVHERLELAICTGQSGVLAQIATICEAVGTYHSSGSLTTAATMARLWLKDRPPAGIQQGDVIELISPEGSYIQDGAYTATQPSTMWQVTAVGFNRPAAGVEGYIDIKPSESAGDCSLTKAVAAGSHFYILKSNEYNSGRAPTSAPVAPSSANVMYGMPDWFVGETASPGVIYNQTRTTQGKQWTVPAMVTKSKGTTITLDHIDQAIDMVFQKRLDMTNLTEMVALTGYHLAASLSNLVGTTNRRVDTAGVEKTKVYANYGFAGTMIMRHALDSAIAIQGVRGLAENRIYLIQPGLCNIIMPGGVMWMPYDEKGTIWKNETDTSGQRTDIYRADRVVRANSLIEVPRLCAGVEGVVPA